MIGKQLLGAPLQSWLCQTWQWFPGCSAGLPWSCPLLCPCSTLSTLTCDIYSSCISQDHHQNIGPSCTNVERLNCCGLQKIPRHAGPSRGKEQIVQGREDTYSMTIVRASASALMRISMASSPAMTLESVRDWNRSLSRASDALDTSSRRNTSLLLYKLFTIRSISLSTCSEAQNLVACQTK